MFDWLYSLLPPVSIRSLECEADWLLNTNFQRWRVRRGKGPDWRDVSAKNVVQIISEGVASLVVLAAAWLLSRLEWSRQTFSLINILLSLLFCAVTFVCWLIPREHDAVQPQKEKRRCLTLVFLRPKYLDDSDETRSIWIWPITNAVSDGDDIASCSCGQTTVNNCAPKHYRTPINVMP